MIKLALVRYQGRPLSFQHVYESTIGLFDLCPSTTWTSLLLKRPLPYCFHAQWSFLKFLNGHLSFRSSCPEIRQPKPEKNIILELVPALASSLCLDLNILQTKDCSPFCTQTMFFRPAIAKGIIARANLFMRTLTSNKFECPVLMIKIGLIRNRTLDRLAISRPGQPQDHRGPKMTEHDK